MSRVLVRRALFVVIPLVAVLFGASVLYARGVAGERRGPTSARLRGTDVFPVGIHRAPPFALRDQNGRLVSTKDLRGQIYAVTFLDSRCRKECPVAGRELASAQRALGPRSQLTVVIVSVDPVADTPASVRRFVRESGLTGRWHWLLGSRSRLLPVWNEYGIAVQPGHGDISHTAAVYLIDRNGWMRVADGVPVLPAQLSQSVRALSGSVNHA